MSSFDYPPPSQQTGSPWPPPEPKKKSRTVLWVVLALVALFFVGCITVVATAANQVSENVSDVPGTSSEGAAADVKVVGCTTENQMMAAVLEIRNSTGEQASYLITVSFDDKDGNQISDGSAGIQNLAPGKVRRETAYSLTADPDVTRDATFTCRVTEVTRL